MRPLVEGDAGPIMTPDSEDPEAFAQRLEAALERIAQATSSRGAANGLPAPGRDGILVAELVARLDSLIAQLRSALGEPA